MRTRGDAAQTGVARWPKWRLFGYQSDPEGILTINLGEITDDCTLLLNYTTVRDGSLRVEVNDLPGHGLDDAVPLTGSSLAAPVAWKGGTTLPARPGQQTSIRLYMEEATVWAYELQ